MKRILLICLLFAVALTTMKFNKIEPELQTHLDIHGQRAESVFVDMSETINYEMISPLLEKMNFIEKGKYLVNELVELSRKTQAPLRVFLDENNIKYENLWIQNSLLLQNVPESIIRRISIRKDVKAIRLDREVVQDLETPHQLTNFTKSFSAEHNVEWIKAPQVWAKGHTGEGIVVAVSDTGVRYTHEALRDNYRGTTRDKNGKYSYNHNYNWFDPSSSLNTPQDRNGHGTHCQGTVCGTKRGVGVAPGAKWITCRPFGGRTSRASNFVKCNQWFLAPTDLNGRNPKPELRAHVTSHSYVCRGCGLRPSIQALYKAGTFFIKSCGNSGPGCRRITEPGNYPEVTCMAALNKGQNVATRFSSRGPALDGHQKPTFAAPGHLVVSSHIGSDSAYRSLSGTSMAAPCFNGAVALLWSAVPRLKGDIPNTLKAFRESSLGQKDSTCDTRTPTPNYVYGYGTINVAKAVEVGKAMVQKLKK